MITVCSACDSLIPPDCRSSQRSARCWATSSTISASSPGESEMFASRVCTSCFQLRIFQPGDAVDGSNKFNPSAAVGLEHCAAAGSQLVITAPPLSFLLYPPPYNPATLLQAIKQGVQRCNVEAQRTLTAFLDELANLVAVASPGFDQREDEQIGAPFFQFTIKALH